MLLYTTPSGNGVSVGVNPDRITTIEPSGDGCRIGFGDGYVTVRESFDTVLSDVMKRLDLRLTPCKRK